MCEADSDKEGEGRKTNFFLLSSFLGVFLSGYVFFFILF
jgi:hypothetical protein